MSLPNSNAARDVAYHLHPITNARRLEKTGPRVMARGQGVYVWDEEGRQYIEGLAGLWSVAVGYGEERLVEAAARQMRELAFYHSFAQKTHGPGAMLAEKLVRMAPAPMSKAFFTNSGSEANDTAVKLLWYVNNARGKPQKKKLIARLRGYHGVTVASASLTGLPLQHKDFDLPIPQVLHTGCPHHWRHALPGESEEEFASRLAGQLEALILREGPETIAAFFGEPVMGAGGVIPPPRTYWEKVQKICRMYDIAIVADEVITGFGRTGNTFGCQTYGITPDILIVSKQLTSSYLPMSALLINEALYQTIADHTDKLGALGHGYTAGAHPVCAAVALENLAIIEERGLVAHAAAMGKRLQAMLAGLADHKLVGEARGVGLIGALELVKDKQSKAGFDKPGSVGLAVFERAHEHGLIIRNIGDIIAVCPPLIIQPEQIDQIGLRLRKTLDEVAKELA